MDSATNNHLFRTTEFRLAAWLRAKGTLYLRTEWISGQQAHFIFRQPSEELLLSWQKGDDDVSARAFCEAQDFLRDELHKGG